MRSNSVTVVSIKSIRVSQQFSEPVRLSLSAVPRNSLNNIFSYEMSWRAPQAAGWVGLYRGADKSLARPGKKQATATEDFDFHMSYL
jgi:hypothetical protein